MKESMCKTCRYNFTIGRIVAKDKSKPYKKCVQKSIPLNNLIVYSCNAYKEIYTQKEIYLNSLNV